MTFDHLIKPFEPLAAPQLDSYVADSHARTWGAVWAGPDALYRLDVMLQRYLLGPLLAGMKLRSINRQSWAGRLLPAGAIAAAIIAASVAAVAARVMLLAARQTAAKGAQGRIAASA